MKLSCIPQGLALAAVLALSSSGAFAASGELQPLSESEMSTVYGRGLSDPTLTALGALTTQEQSRSGLSATDALAALGAISNDGSQALDRQMDQQRLQTTVNGVQATVKLAQNLTALDKALAPIASAVTLPFMLMPMFGLPSLASLNAIQNKH
ncbi:hypothetical protein [Scleromatobacter humisilvae]|uniref:Uncharacterized protein n=1 Tax=Scleromatobacter humisilvae TaxID=2897159 RepID=A0A9X2C3C8_9BURK|nr:hypothetical protein [Scleromatobacter humisilvae]MCK9687245.1 hypothetical protein [Scleromatobacter humisilvae]